jgi:hypothetical protein
MYKFLVTNQMNNKTVILLLLLIIVYIYWKIKEEDRIEKFESGIPKIIWSYWDNPETVPKTVKLCMESWKKQNPNYEIRMLNKVNFSEYVKIEDEILNNPNYNDIPAHFSDLVRIHALEKYGGVWVDSSMLMSKPLDSWLFEESDKEFYGFYFAGFTTTKPVIENWFFACKQNSKFMKLWLQEYLNVSKYASIEEYVNSRKEMDIDITKINGPIYLFQHVAAQKVLQIDKYPIDKLSLSMAEEGPYKYLVEANWDSNKGVHSLCDDENGYYSIIKMRGGERRIFEDNYDKLSNCECIKKCII